MLAGTMMWPCDRGSLEERSTNLSLSRAAVLLIFDVHCLLCTRTDTFLPAQLFTGGQRPVT